MVKVSVVMPVYNASRFLNESVNSILNQTLRDLELICVDDGSTDNSLEILNSFDDPRIKVYSCEHQGGGNARNYGLSKITGKYLFCMDADDILDLNAFDEFYNISEEKNLDFLVFKAINYGVEKDHFFETEYQNMTRIYNKVTNNVFSYKDLGNLLFDFNVSPWCKFYNSEFVKSTGAKFRENSKFHDNQFFWDIIFKAERIYFMNKFYYTRKRYDHSLTASGDIGHIDIIDVVNDIIYLFIKHDQLNNYKHILYNLKITWILDRYKQTQEKFKFAFFKKMKSDYLPLKTSEFPKLLDENEKFIYDCVIISKDPDDFDLINGYYQINKEDSNKKINELTNKINTAEKTMNELENRINENKKIINNLNNENTNNKKIIYELNNNIQTKEKTINELNNNIQTKEKTINDLNDTIKNKDKNITKLNNHVDHIAEINKNNSIKISELENTNKSLTEKNDYLKNELEQRFSVKKIFKKVSK